MAHCLRALQQRHGHVEGRWAPRADVSAGRLGGRREADAGQGRAPIRTRGSTQQEETRPGTVHSANGSTWVRQQVPKLKGDSTSLVRLSRPLGLGSAVCSHTVGAATPRPHSESPPAGRENLTREDSCVLRTPGTGRAQGRLSASWKERNGHLADVRAGLAAPCVPTISWWHLRQLSLVGSCF